jgi:outer membrane lipoprotein-sorting protein
VHYDIGKSDASSDRRMRIALAAAVVGLVAAAPVAQSLVPSFEALHLRGRERQARITSVVARFVETTVSSLLVEPVVARGTLVAVKPGRVVLQYTSGEPRTVVIDGPRLLLHWPRRDERETLNIAETQERVQKYFAGAGAAELRRLFEIGVAADPAAPSAYRIGMKPKREQIRKSLERLVLWVDRESVLMTRMRMEFPGGDTKDIQLEDVRLNVPVDESLFSVPEKRSSVASESRYSRR